MYIFVGIHFGGGRDIISWPDPKGSPPDGHD
jgi:hypothetical protein